MRIALQHVGSKFVWHLAYAVDVSIYRTVCDAQILLGVDDAELCEAFVNPLGVAADPVLTLLVASCENEG